MSDLASIEYRCERCGTVQSMEELSRFPDIRSKNSGYRTLKKLKRASPKKVGAV